MKASSTLNWIQKQANGAVRVNIQTVFTDETTGAVKGTTGEDITLESPEVLAAAAAFEQSVMTALDVALPPAEPAPASPAA